LDNEQGIPLEVAFTNRDVFGNSSRYFVNIEDGIKTIQDRLEGDKQGDFCGKFTKNARKSVEQRTWDIPNQQLDRKIKELIGE
jgi:hypothetical protein